MSDYLNETHDPSLRSWVQSANEQGCDFPIQNLPFGVFLSAEVREPCIGVAIGDKILNMPSCANAGILRCDSATIAALEETSLNALMALGRDVASSLRKELSELLREGNSAQAKLEARLIDMKDATMLLPVDIGDYTDFYASIHHANNVGKLFRPDNPLLPNYKHIPIGYHGRASSIIPSGTAVRRPYGQTKKDPTQEAPSWGVSRLLDYETEVGVFVGPGNSLGESISIQEAEKHLWGLCLVNDWSARDIQSWEYQPLGPFLAKSFATTISPWVITLDALVPFRAPLLPRAEGDPEPLPYLSDIEASTRGAFDITLEAYLLTPSMRSSGEMPVRLSRASFKDMYWSLAQMLTHHASNGCNLRPGDLLASGTVSGSEREARGCLLELTARGSEPIMLPNGEERRFLQDGDEITMRGFCQKEGFQRIGFGECRGEILPAKEVRDS